MSLRSPAEDENGRGSSCRQGWPASGARDASRDIHVAWIPALHAGMTELRSRTETEPGSPPFVFSKEFIG
jgi:hypothetical protein